ESRIATRGVAVGRDGRRPRRAARQPDSRAGRGRCADTRPRARRRLDPDRGYRFRAVGGWGWGRPM
ncbi:MAG: hypothetical protein AVDCRST_MAG49-13, partial [uncultured Thermomicrobiales bacterium]